MHKFNIKNIEKLDNPERRRTMPPEETLLKFKVADDGTLLDVGCGIGYFTVPASNLLKNNKVIGIDIVPEILDFAKEKAEGINNIEFKNSEEYTFPVQSDSVKYVLICNVIHEVEDVARYFDEVKRVLKDDGYFLIIDWVKTKMEVGPPIQDRISVDEMVQLCNSAGFKAIETIDVSPTQYGLRLEKQK
ncbi:class I SAM-dependent methyltransferase [Clostridium estertheticum]|uniref:class I SAM-dependent methyltransferase n=1 Tax=Clostridium estertheticum TaxID=238834 RepID=UPI0013E93C0B|nr:class I SAM-dependent methyltransferase [Clostridium estertheticum]MBZ9686590.1 class I SAM-dependent methyltransferase [Clostridium estertheticum]